MRAGLLRHQADIQRKHTTGVGDRGQPTFTWQAQYSSVPVCIEPLTGRKLEIARQLVPTCTHRITLRYQSDFTAQDRIKYGSRIFNIGHLVTKDERPFEQECICTEEI